MQVLQLSLQSSHRPSSIPRKTFRGTKLCMNLFLQAQAQAQVQTQAQVNRSDQAPRKRPLKAPPPDLYFGKSHMECYHFCQQCEDHFDTAGATGTNRIPFAASFLRGRRVKRDSQFQQEEVQNWASHLEHLQSIHIEFDADGAPEESDLIRFFREGLKPLVKAQMEQRGREIDSWEDLVEKAIDAEAKASLQPPSSIREMDQRCPRGNRLAHTTVAKSSTRDPQEEPYKKA